MLRDVENFQADPKLDEVIERIYFADDVAGYGDMPWSAREDPQRTVDTLLAQNREALRQYLLPYHESGKHKDDFETIIERRRKWFTQRFEEQLFAESQ